MWRTSAISASAIALLGAVIAVRAQQPPAAAPARPAVPVAASSVILDPNTYVGENVSMVAAVEQRLTPTAFSVDQDKNTSTGKEVLVLAPTLQAAVQLNSYVTIIGEVIKFDPAEVAKKLKDYKLDLPDDVVAKYRGKPAVLATAVINAELTDLAKRLPPPMAPAELTLQNAMKQMTPGQTALRTALDGTNAEASRQQIAVLKKAFGDAQTFFKTRGTADAAGWADEGVKAMDTADQSVLAGKWDAAKTALGGITQLCSSCHAAHRERFDDGSFRVKG